MGFPQILPECFWRPNEHFSVYHFWSPMKPQETLSKPWGLIFLLCTLCSFCGSCWETPIPLGLILGRSWFFSFANISLIWTHRATVFGEVHSCLAYFPTPWWFPLYLFSLCVFEFFCIPRPFFDDSPWAFAYTLVIELCIVSLKPFQNHALLLKPCLTLNLGTFTQLWDALGFDVPKSIPIFAQPFTNFT